MKKAITYGLMLPATAALIGLGAYGDPPPDSQPIIPPQVAAQMAKARGGSSTDELPKFDDVAKDYEKVVSTADGKESLYTVWKRDKDAQMLAELPRNFERAALVHGLHDRRRHADGGCSDPATATSKWKRFDKRLALIEPNYEVRTTGDLESKTGYARVFTDRVILDVPIVAMGPGGGPVVDLDALLLGQSGKFFGFATQGINPALSKIAKAKAFPENVEVAFEVPLASGRFATLYYSIKSLPENTGYKPRKADERSRLLHDDLPGHR